MFLCSFFSFSHSFSFCSLSVFIALEIIARKRKARTCGFKLNLMFTFVHKSCSACFVWWYSPNGELSIYHIYFHIAQKHTSAHEHALVRTGTTTHNHVCYLYHNRYTLIWVVFLVFVFIFALVVSGCCCRICSLSGTDGQIRN